MNNEDLEPFWVTSAQVIPVISLALVLEARLLARRFSKKRKFAKKFSRNAWGIAYLIVTLLLLIAMLVSLLAIAFPPPPDAEISQATQAFVCLVLVAIVLGIYFTFSIPLSAIYVSLFGVAAIRFLERLPWIGEGSVTRKARAVENIALGRIAECKQARHELVMLSARVMMNVVVHERYIDKIEESKPVRAPNSLDLERKRQIGQMKALVQKGRAEYLEIQERIQETWHLEEVLREALRRLRPIIDGDPSDGGDVVEFVRKKLSEAGQV